MGIPNSTRLLYKTSLLTFLKSILADELPHCILILFSSVWGMQNVWSVVDLLHRNPHWWSPVISWAYGQNDVGWNFVCSWWKVICVDNILQSSRLHRALSLFLHGVPHTRTTVLNKICRHNTENISNDTHIWTRHVILAKHWLWLPDDGFVWTETCWSGFYNCNYFNNLTILYNLCALVGQ
jgi:hypothetical protein